MDSGGKFGIGSWEFGVEAMRISVNGEARDVADGITVAALLAMLGVDAARVAVLAGAEAVPRGDYAARVLRDGETVDVLTFAGGG